ncbi:MAG: hypothetical protein DHS20C08_01200 [Rhodomicrobium sp.]|nr:MAG: hypothetical protein DHS20C08_01200 [Rhodomicrobium sp.]
MWQPPQKKKAPAREPLKSINHLIQGGQSRPPRILRPIGAQKILRAPPEGPRGHAAAE